MSNLMQSLSHTYTYQMENRRLVVARRAGWTHFVIAVPRSRGASALYRWHWSLWYTRLCIKAYLMQLCYIKHEQKNAFNQKKNKVYRCCCHAPWSCSVGLRAQTLMWLLLCFFFSFFPLDCVLCSFILLIWVVSRRRAAGNAQTSRWGALFLPCCFLGLCEAPWVLFPFVCVRCCAFDLCCAQLFSPLIMRCLSYLKKARRHLPEV